MISQDVDLRIARLPWVLRKGSVIGWTHIRVTGGSVFMRSRFRISQIKLGSLKNLPIIVNGPV